jgi:hypothetical protein
MRKQPLMAIALGLRERRDFTARKDERRGECERCRVFTDWGLTSSTRTGDPAPLFRACTKTVFYHGLGPFLTCR